MQELVDALAVAVGGDLILCAPEQFGKLTLRGKSYTSDVVITSADREVESAFDGLDLRNVEHLVFDGVRIKYWAQGDVTEVLTNVITNSKFIKFINCSLVGDLEAKPGYGLGTGLHFTNTDDVTIDRCAFGKWYAGLVFSGGQRLLINGCEFTWCNKSGISFSGVDGLTSDRSWIYQFHTEPGVTRDDPIYDDIQDKSPFGTNITDTNTMRDDAQGRPPGVGPRNA